MPQWPKDNQRALIAFYGEPGPAVEAQLVPVKPPFKMCYEGKPVASIKFHKKAAFALAAALDEIWNHYGRDQKKIDALGISNYAGAYNPRKIRGSATKWSNHAYGAAIDLDADRNGFGKGKGTIPRPVIDAFKRQGARWGGDYKGRTDPMHFEFCDNGQPAMPAYVPPPPPDVEPTDTDPVTLVSKPLAKSKTFWASLVAAATTAGGALLDAASDWRVWAAATALIAVLYIIYERSGKPDIKGIIR